MAISDNQSTAVAKTIPKHERVALLIDRSGSMSCSIPNADGTTADIKSRIQAAIEAVHAIINNSNPKLTEYAFLSFSNGTDLHVPWTSDYLEIAANCWPEPEAGTPLGEAITDTLLLDPKPERIILLSDGQPDSRERAETAARAAAEQRVIIDTVGIGEADDGLMAYIAEITGGRYSKVANAQALGSIFQALETRARFFIEHRPGGATVSS